MLNPEFRDLPDRVKRELFALLPDVGYLALGWGLVTVDECVDAIREAVQEGRRIVEEEGIESRVVQRDGEDVSVGFQSWALRAKGRDNYARMVFWTEALTAPPIPLSYLLTTVFQPGDGAGRLERSPVEDFLLPPPPEDFDLTTEPPTQPTPGEGWAGRAVLEFGRALLSTPDGSDPAEGYRALRDPFVESAARPLRALHSHTQDEGDFLPDSLEGLDFGPGIEWRVALYINAHDFEQGPYFAHWPTPIEEDVSILGSQYGETPEERVRAIAEELTQPGGSDRLLFRVKRYRADGPNLPVALREAVAERAGMSRTQAAEYLARSGFELPRDLLFTLKRR